MPNTYKIINVSLTKIPTKSNTQAIRYVNWGNYRVSINALENATGYDFLSPVPDAVEKIIEEKIDTGPTQ